MNLDQGFSPKIKSCQEFDLFRLSIAIGFETANFPVLQVYFTTGTALS